MFALNKQCESMKGCVREKLKLSKPSEVREKFRELLLLFLIHTREINWGKKGNFIREEILSITTIES